LFRSLDGFDDEWGKEDGGSLAEAAPAPLDAAGLDAERLDGESVDAGISCSAPEILWDGGVRSLAGPYLHGMAHTPGAGGRLYVVGGSYASSDGPDAGFVLQLNKAPPFDPALIRPYNEPRAVVSTEAGVFFSARNTIYRIPSPEMPPQLVHTVEPDTNANVIGDLAAEGADLYFTTGTGSPAGRLHMRPQEAPAPLVTIPYPNPSRVLADKYGVFVTSREDGGNGVGRLDRGPLMSATVCVVDPKPAAAIALGATMQQMVWGGVGPEIDIAKEMACAPPLRATTEGPPLAMAVGPRGVFVRYAGSVALYTFQLQRVVGCAWPLLASDEGLLQNRGTQSAFFEDDYIFFQTPQRVYRMRVVPQ
jgi:hypothetical protein